MVLPPSIDFFFASPPPPFVTISWMKTRVHLSMFASLLSTISPTSRVHTARIALTIASQLLCVFRWDFSFSLFFFFFFSERQTHLYWFVRLDSNFFHWKNLFLYCCLYSRGNNRPVFIYQSCELFSIRMKYFASILLKLRLSLIKRYGGTIIY